MSELNKEDWADWANKLKWAFLSFKAWSFWTAVLILIGFWFSLERLNDKTIETAKELYNEKVITQDNVTTIVTHAQSVFYDSALSHGLLALTAILTSIIAIRGVSYYTDSRRTEAAINKMNGDATKEDLKKFIPRRK